MGSKDNDLASSLKKRIWGNMLHLTDPRQTFFPNSGWDGLLVEAEVKATLKECGEHPVPVPDLVDFVLKKASKIFAILVTMGQPKLITAFYTNGFGQDKLPVKLKYAQKMLEQAGWDLGSIVEFYGTRQWWFITPTFTKEKFRHEFEGLYHLPFTTPGKLAGATLFSTVEERSIHIDHVELRTDQKPPKDESGNLRVAVKKLTNLDQKSAKEEARALEIMRELQSDHLIKAIAYYQHDNHHYFMFPWAEHGNLWEFWMKGGRASLEKPYLIWVFKQLKGLSIAIEQLHGESCRHGDLKPENILCFRESDEKDGGVSPEVRMVITDVGLARSHKEATQFREATNTTVSTMRYAGPEMEVTPNGPLSRRFDIWSMGCILLEFVVWILYGWEELLRCTEALNPTFYKIKRNEGGAITSAEIHPTVQKWVSYIRKDWRCSKGTALGRLVDLIIKKLLVVNIDYAGLPHSPTLLGTEPQLVQKVADLKIIEPSERLQYRTYILGMREELEDILTGLETDKINAIGEKPPGGSANAQGPSYSMTSTQGGLLAPGPSLTRLTDNWIYTPDDIFPVAFFNDIDLAAVIPQAVKPQLCYRCRTLSLWSIECNFVDSQGGLITKARNDKCELCQLLSYCIRDRPYSPSDAVHFARVGSYLTIDDGKEQPVVNLCTVPGPKVKSLKNIQTGFSKLPEAGSEAHFKVLREWIRNCDSNHDCVPKQLGFVPTRLLDISESESDIVRLLETNSTLKQPKDYAALSHRWGPPEHNEKFCATKAKIKVLKSGFKASHLPKTFRDAVAVTRGLQLDYLWIDSVCIVQDDSHDWDIESKLMEQVFSSAYCTLAASCALGTSDGFLKVRAERRCIPMTMGDATYYACETIDDFRTHVDQSELNQRGWVMQERALSRRTIYFAEKQSYWECGGGVRCETMTKMRNRKASFLGDAKFPQSAEEYVKGLKIEFFQDLYVRYSKLALSFAHDRPVAIKGLETRLLNTFNTTGGHGIIDLYLHRALLWKRQGEDFSRITTTRGEPVPSWSWMAYDGAIHYLSVPGGNVAWSDEVKSPFSRALGDSKRNGDGEAPTLEAPVWEIANNPAKELVFLDKPGQAFSRSMKCVVLGKCSSGPLNEFQTHWVILVDCISTNANGSGGQVYERLGVAVLERRHIDFQGRAREGKIR